jgi:hypothetical protein
MNKSTDKVTRNKSQLSQSRQPLSQLILERLASECDLLTHLYHPSYIGSDKIFPLFNSPNDHASIPFT